MTPKKIWTPEQVEQLNRNQRNEGRGIFNQLHPFTCGNDRGDEAHRTYQMQHPGEDLGQLVATEYGWVCPVPGCNYRQGWCHDFQLEAPRALTDEEQELEAAFAQRLKDTPA